MAVQIITLKSILAAVLGLFLFCSVAKADECITVEKFATAMAEEGIALRGSTAAATKKLAILFNKNREARGQPAAKISIFLFGLVTANSGDQGALVAIADKSGCVVGRSITILSLRTWVEYTTLAGVSAKDFIPLDGA